MKSKSMGGAKTLNIPSVEDIAQVIKAIPMGGTKTIDELRSQILCVRNP